MIQEYQVTEARRRTRAFRVGDDLVTGTASSPQEHASDGSPGLDLREWLTGQALVGLAVSFHERGVGAGQNDTLAKMAREAVELADAVLVAMCEGAEDRKAQYDRDVELIAQAERERAAAKQQPQQQPADQGEGQQRRPGWLQGRKP